MKINVTKSNLQKALNAVSKAVSTKPTVEIIKNIALNAEKGVLTIFATDIESSILTYIGADIIEEGKTTILAKNFIEFVSLLPDGNISLILENSELKVEAEKIKSKFATIPYEEFPVLSRVNEESIPVFKMPKDIFIKSMEKTTFAVDRANMSQPVFTGVLFHNAENKINIVSTDKFRLSKYSVVGVEEYTEKISPIVPYTALDNITKLCLESEDEFIECYLIKKNNQILFKSGRIELCSNLLDGEFPNYQAFLPQKTIATYSINMAELINAVKLSSVFGKKEDALRVNFHKSMDSDFMVISSRVSEVGEYETELLVQKLLEEENIDINFSPKKILDILNKITSENILIDVVVHPRTDHKMFIFREDGNNDFIHLLTPLA